MLIPKQDITQDKKTRVCNRCKEEKPYARLVKSYDNKIGYRKFCKQCRNAELRAQRGFNNGLGFSKEKWRPLQERFLERVSKTENCWIWNGSVSKGYGRMKVDNKVYSAHRLSFKLFKGKIPKNRIICHTCDNPKCVNPEHLYAGTPQTNSDDKFYRGRQRYNPPCLKGEDNGFSKLDTKTIHKIRNEKGAPKDIAEKFGLSLSHVRRIISRESWGHV